MDLFWSEKQTKLLLLHTTNKRFQEEINLRLYKEIYMLLFLLPLFQAFVFVLCFFFLGVCILFNQILF